MGSFTNSAVPMDKLARKRPTAINATTIILRSMALFLFKNRVLLS
jgi:hypothetical protein